MIARLYSNENFPLPVVQFLRERGHDVLTTRDAGKVNEGIPDDEDLRFAVEIKRAVITHYRQDFICPACGLTVNVSGGKIEVTMTIYCEAYQTLQARGGHLPRSCLGPATAKISEMAMRRIG